MKRTTGSRINKRWIFMTLLIVAVMFSYLIRLFSMQIVDTYLYNYQADAISRRKQVIFTQRGEIFDRNFDQPLVTNIPAFVIFLDPGKVPQNQLDPLILSLARNLETDPQYLLENVSNREKLSGTNYEIWRHANFQQVTRIAEQIDNFPGVSWKSRAVRYYPQRGLFSHVLGYTGEISSEELRVLYNQGYASAREIGKTGIEKQYDSLLRGKDGISYGRFDATGQRIRGLGDTPPELGKSLVLTIDRHIQELAHKALGKRSGGVVVLDPSNGEVLALVSYPSYDPNTFSITSDPDEITSIHTDPGSPLLNRTIQSAASPASTFKILMATALLQEETFNPENTIYCPGLIWVGNRAFHCHEEHGHGHVNMYSALAESCNVYFYTIGKDYLGVDGILDYSLRFGLGELTSIDLPGEVPGLLPSPEWKKKQFDDQWVTGDTVNMSIGQGFLTLTPLQLANITAGVVNDGVIYEPHILKEVRDQISLNLIDEIKPRILKNTGIRPEAFQEVRKAMRSVITDGTPRVVFTTNTPEIGGKTGTAQTDLEEELHSWFTAYIPSLSNERNYVVTVWVDKFNDWEWWAPKAANIIIHGIANELTFEQTINDLKPLWYYPPPNQTDNEEILITESVEVRIPE